MNIPWNPNYCIGSTRIDAQHEQLFALANAMLASSTHEALKLHAMQLYQAVRQHFDEEEALMKQAHFPGMRIHMEAHNTILSKLVNLSTDVGDNRISIALVEDFLNEWGLRHIPGEDAELANFLKTLPSNAHQGSE